MRQGERGSEWAFVGTATIVRELIEKMGLSYADAANSCDEAALFFRNVHQAGGDKR